MGGTHWSPLHDAVQIEPLNPEQERAAFSCGQPALDRYLSQQAGQDLRNRVAAVFVLRRADDPAILGYYTLSASVIDPGELPAAVRKRLPKYPALPAVLLGRLAVALREQGRGWGKVLLLDALQRSLRYHEQIAAMAVVVHAKDDAAKAFYERFGFVEFLEHPQHLYLLLKDIEQLFPS